MREYSNYNAPSNMLVILSREDDEGPHTSPWITQVACVNSRPICEVPRSSRRPLGMIAGKSESHFHAPIRRAPQCGKPENFRVMLVR